MIRMESHSLFSTRPPAGVERQRLAPRAELPGGLRPGPARLRLVRRRLGGRLLRRAASARAAG